MRIRLFLVATLTLLVAAILRLWQLHMYPPGPHYDEAVYLIMTRSIAFGGFRPFPIFEAYQGREVLYMYLSAPMLYLFGNDIFTLRVTSVFCNLITIAASIRMGREMFRGERGIIVGLTIGILMTWSFPQIWLARQAFRAVTLPMCQALALMFMWKGLNARRNGWRWLAASGFCGGAAVYTYMASRLFPFWLLLGGLALLALDRRNWKQRLRQGLVAFGVMGATALPMALYAVQRPDIFLERYEEVTVASAKPVTLGTSVVLHLKMFFIQGDPYVRYNIPRRPYFTWPEGILLLVGLGAAMWYVVRGRKATERAASFLALLSPLMVIPSVASVGGLLPSHLRSLGMVPLIFVLVALGFEAILRLLSNLSQRSGTQAKLPLGVVLGLMALILAVGAVLAGRTYFRWAGRTDVFYQSDADLALAAKWLPMQVDASTIPYLAAQDRGHPTVMIEPEPPITWLGTDSLFRAPPGKTGLYIFPRSAPPPPDWLAWLEPGRITSLPLGPDGRTAFEAFRLPGTTPLPPSDPLPDAVVTNGPLKLIWVSLPPLVAGEQKEIVMGWQINGPPPFADLTPLLQIEDDQGTVFFRGEAYMTETDRWRPGEVLFQRMKVNAHIGTPPDRYAIKIAWIGKSGNQYLPYIRPDGDQAGIWAEIGQLEVRRPASFPNPSKLAMDIRQPVDVAPGVRLLGWNRAPREVRPGEALPITLFWQAVPTNTRSNIKVEAVLQGDRGDAVLWAGSPVSDTYPSDQWVDAELVTDHEHWPVSRDQADGAYKLVLRVGEMAVDLGTVQVSGLPRLFEPPPMGKQVADRFGDALELYGYELDAGPSTLQLDLVWHALKTVERDYAVFVHVVDSNGQIIAQQDMMPVDNGYPTGLWESGEYVIDHHTFSNLPPGRYFLRVGLYLQSDGSRLPVSDSSGQVIGDFVTINP